MKINSLSVSSLSRTIVAVLLFGSPSLAVAAGTRVDDAGRLDESRPTEELEVDMRAAVDRDTDVANTALTFNNVGVSAAIVVCRAFDGRGTALGIRAVHVPANGLRYLRASDFADGADFVGSAVCKSRVRVHGSAVFLAPGALTNLNVIHNVRKRVTTIRFPLVATY